MAVGGPRGVGSRTGHPGGPASVRRTATALAGCRPTPHPTARVLRTRGVAMSRHPSNSACVAAPAESVGAGSRVIGMNSAGDVRWGIVGPGRIAAKVVEDFAYAPGAVAVAAASRSIERARAFCDEHGLETAYGSYARHHRRPGHRRPLHRHPAPAAPPDRRGRAAGRQGRAGGEDVHRDRRRGRGHRRHRAGHRRVRDGGDVDPVPARGRRRPHADRERGDRRGPPAAGRSRA